MLMRWERMEKRLEHRYNIPMRAILSFSDATTQNLKILDISSGGAFLMTKQAKPEGTEVVISLQMDTTLDRQIVRGGVGRLKPTELIMSLFKDAKPDNKIGEGIAIKLKGVVKRSYDYGMAVAFNNQYCIDRV